MYLLDELRTGVEVFFVGHQKDCFQTGIKMPVHLSHLKFIFEIGNCPQSSNQNTGIFFSSIINQQSRKSLNTTFFCSVKFSSTNLTRSDASNKVFLELFPSDTATITFQKTACTGKHIKMSFSYRVKVPGKEQWSRFIFITCK